MSANVGSERVVRRGQTEHIEDCQMTTIASLEHIHQQHQRVFVAKSRIWTTRHTLHANTLATLV